MKKKFLDNSQKAIGTSRQSIKKQNLVNREEIFVGREKEIREFRQMLEKLCVGSEQQNSFDNTIVIYGVAGMGKTRLCEEFMRIAGGKSRYSRLVQVSVNWESSKECGEPEELLETISHQFEKPFPKEIKPYKNARKGLKKVEEEIAQQEQQSKNVFKSTQETLKNLTEAQGTKTVGKVIAAVCSFGGMLLSTIYWKRKFKLIAGEQPDLAQCLCDCITTIADKKGRQLLLIMDACELIGQHEKWLIDNFLIPLVNGNPYVALVFSGQHNVERQHRLFIGGQEQIVSGFEKKIKFHQRKPFRMKEFNQEDVKNYLEKITGTDVDSKIIDFVVSYSRGVPCAVRLLTDAFEELGFETTLRNFGDKAFKKELDEVITNEEIIIRVAEQFMKYCINSTTDRDRILSLAILDDTRTTILKKAWQVDNPGTILRTLQAQYALFIGGKLHETVSKFLCDYVLEDEHVYSETVKPIVKRVLPIYYNHYERQCQKKPDWEDRFWYNEWKKAAKKLLNALVWANLHDAIDFFLKRCLELLFINPFFIAELNQPLEKFQNFKESFEEFVDIDDLFKALISITRSTIGDVQETEDNEELINLLLEKGEWEPVHKAILYFMKGWVRYYHQNKYEDALVILSNCPNEDTLDKAIITKLAETVDNLGVVRWPPLSRQKITNVKVQDELPFYTLFFSR